MRSEREDRCASPRCRHSGVPVPTIKYCLREGLPRPGELTSPDQAQYDKSHLRQLRLIRALAEVGGLSIAAIGDLLAARGSPGTSLHDALGKAQYATTPGYGHPAGDASRQAGAPQGGELIRGRGWRAKPDTPARELLTGVLAALRDLGQDRPARLGRRLRRARRADRRRRPGRDPRTAEPGRPARRGSSSAPSSVTSCSRRCGACPGRTRSRHSGSGRHHATGDRRPAEASQQAGAGQPLAGSNLASHPPTARTGDR